jgi:hypothetical protein
MSLFISGRLTFGFGGSLRGAYSGQIGNVISGGLRSRFFGGFNPKSSGYPSGYNKSGFVLPKVAGAMSSFTRSRSQITYNSDLIPAFPSTANASASLQIISAALNQIVRLIASGSASVSTISAALAGGAKGQAVGSAQLTIINAQAGAIVLALANGSASITSEAGLRALAHMVASAGGPTPLSPEGLANAVLDAMLADHTEAGTVGEALNNVSASSNPWSAPLDGNDSDGTFGEQVQKLLTKTQFIALKD